MADEVRLIDGNALKEDFMNDYTNYMMESLRGNHHDVIRISEVIERIEDAPTIEAEPVKHEQRIDHEKLIGIFGALCDYMVDNCKCDVFCPYADTKDKNDECEAWRTIQKIRGEAESETD